MGTPPSPSLTVALHSRLHSDDTFSDSAAVVEKHLLVADPASWTRFLLRSSHIQALEEFEQLSDVHTLGAVAKFDVATVTGANAFFSLTAAEVQHYGLDAWARPLLPRSKHAPGLVYSENDFDAMVDADVPAYIFDASLHAADRSRHAGLDEFLSKGESQNLHERFKCRIRSPWWAIPGIRRGDLLLSKRCHRHPRMILNQTAAITTDTIYRGRMISTWPAATADCLVAGFHNSGTLLSAELEGRNFGGGVLELVPSEVSRLRVPMAEAMRGEMDRLDRTSRDGSGTRGDDWHDVLRHETDLLLRKAGIGLTTQMLDALAEGRSLLVNRRLDRSIVDRSGDSGRPRTCVD